MSTGQSSIEKAEESVPQHPRTTSSTKGLKVSNGDQKQNVPTDSDASVARGFASEGDGYQERRMEKSPERVEACEDCE